MLLSLFAATTAFGPGSFAGAVNEFGVDVFQRLSTKNEKNVLVSPLSLGTALAMAAEGADGANWNEMAKTLRVDGLGREGMNSGAESLIRELASADESTRMEIANALWANQAYRFESAYVQALQSHYGAEAKTLDFSSTSAIPTMNSWVAEKTHGKITQIVSDLPADSLMVLMNAVSFKGDWVVPFDPNSNIKRPFNGQGEADYMRRMRSWDYFEEPGVQFVRLPYGNSRFSMEVALPASGTEMTEFIRGLSADKWREWSKAARSKLGMVTLPKWKSEYSVELGSTLKQMGMKSAFAPGADFTRMIKSPPAYIGLVNHKTFIQVDEKGTEAAAVTSIQFRAGSARPPEDRFEFNANRSFIYAITEAETGAILFLGSVRSI